MCIDKYIIILKMHTLTILTNTQIVNLQFRKECGYSIKEFGS